MPNRDQEGIQMGKHLVLVLFCLMGMAGVSHSAVINVPADRPTIQAGIDAAQNGDTVLVADGVYKVQGTKNLTFNRSSDPPIKNITLGSAGGPANCIIDHEGSTGAYTFYFGHGETSDSVVDGFTIRNLGTSGGGIWCKNGSSPTITNNIITGNNSEWGGGIYCLDNSHPVITNNTISGNNSRSGGGGIRCEWYSSPTITNNTITGNSNELFFGGGGICCWRNSHPVIANNTIGGNSAHHGGGISCTWNSSPTITNNIIIGNSSNPGGGGGGICCYSSPTITSNIIADNSATSGGGIICADSSAAITNNVIAGNSAIERGGGIEVTRSSGLSAPTVTNNTIVDNSAGEGGGISCYWDSSPVVVNTILWNNTPDQIYLPALDSQHPNTITVSYSDVQGGEAGIVTNYNGVVFWLDGNIDADPMFVDADNGDYHLSSFSPCIIAGTNNGAPATDIEGNPRPDPPDSMPDMGAYETSLLPTFGLPEVTTISPNRGGNTGLVTLTISGRNLHPDAEVRLVKTGEPDIAAIYVSGSLSGTRLTATFDLLDETPGVWNLEVTNPGGGNVTVENAFTIEFGGQSQLSVNILGRDLMRIGRRHTYFVEVENSGNVDSSRNLLLSIRITNADAEFDLPPPPPDLPDGVDWSQTPMSFQDGDATIFPIWIQKVGAKSTLPVAVILSAPAVQEPVWMEAAVAEMLPVDPPYSSPPDDVIFPDILNSKTAWDFYVALHGPEQAEIAREAYAEAIRILRSAVYQYAFAFALRSLGYAGWKLYEAEEIILATALAMNSGDFLDIVKSMWYSVESLRPICQSQRRFYSAQSLSPEDKYGPIGYDPEDAQPDQRSRFVKGDQSFDYRIDFWNREDAPVPTQDVFIEDQLDSNLDWSTFEFGEFGFLKWGVDVPPGTKQLDTTLDLRPDNDLLVRIQASIDTDGKVSWVFSSIELC
jgi:parallel beta-helix repeat protein